MKCFDLKPNISVGVKSKKFFNFPICIGLLPELKGPSGELIIRIPSFFSTLKQLLKHSSASFNVSIP